MMKNKGKSMLVTSVINLDQWNKAKWRAVVFAANGKSAPYMGFAFEDRQAAINIFKEWKERFNSRDRYDEIRISIIEGDIVGQEYGYTVHINTNIENILSKCKENNLQPESTLVMTVGRYNRMNPQRDSKNLEQFKEEFNRYLSYKIFPVFINKQKQLELLWDYAIEKTEIFFRNVNDILDNDIDACCVKRNI